MRQLLHFGEIVAMNAYLSPDKVGARDLTRSLTFRGWNERSCKLANALVGLGLEKGDRLAVLAYNCLEWMEIYAAVAKAGLIAVMRLRGRRMGANHWNTRRLQCHSRLRTD
jgi:fatty-acyl-CoA synthase